MGSSIRGQKKEEKKNGITTKRTPYRLKNNNDTSKEASKSENN